MIRRHIERWELAVDRFAYGPWSSASLWVFTVVWVLVERGNIGFDGFLTVVGVELALSIRRWQGKRA